MICTTKLETNHAAPSIALAVPAHQNKFRPLLRVYKNISQHSLNHLIISIALLVFLSSYNNPAWSSVIDSNVTFSSQNQSMWGTGTAFQLDQNKFYGTTWNKSASFGQFVGGATQVVNPLWLAWNTCRFFCGSAPPKHFNVDTKTGLQVTANTQGKIGFNVGIKVDSGSVDASVNYNTQVIAPEFNSVAQGEFISLNQSSALTGNDLSSQFPAMSASLDVVMEVSAQFAATGCLLGACDSTSFNTGTLGGTQELISFNQDRNGGIEYFGGTGPLSYALDVAVAAGAVSLPTGFPAVIGIPAPSGLGNIAKITAHLSEPNTTYSGLDASGSTLTSQGQDDFLDFSLDIDNIISVATTGTGGLFNGSLDIGNGFGLSYDLINVELGPQIDLVQSFEFTPSLYVDLEFSQPTQVTGYGTVTSLAGLLWDSLPTMAFGDGTTSIIPTFYLGTTINDIFTKNEGTLLDELLLDIDGNFKVDLLTATISSIFGKLNFGFGNLIDQSFDLFQTPAFFSEKFAMAGFSPYVGVAFNISVPEPGIVLLFGTGFMLIGFVRRTRTL